MAKAFAIQFFVLFATILLQGHLQKKTHIAIAPIVPLGMKRKPKIVVAFKIREKESERVLARGDAVDIYTGMNANHSASAVYVQKTI